MKILWQLLCMLTLLTCSFLATATIMCSTSDVLLTDVQLVPETQILPLPDPLVDPFPDPPDTSIPPVEASECVGLLIGNDQPLPSTNIGQYGDGLLNGGVPQGNNNDSFLDPVNTLFDPAYDNGDSLKFISKDDLQDLDGVGDLYGQGDDPGWVYLGKDEGADFGYATAGDGLLGETFIGDVVDINFSCAVGAIGNGCTSGTWSIMPDYDIADTLFDLFGEGVFDHLAFVFKTGNVDDTDKGSNFAIYDFNFNTLLGGGVVA